MSGLCGIVDLRGAPVDPTELAPMVDAAAYRGRDGVVTWHGVGAALAYQSTIVTPESRRERQPAVDPATGVVLMADVRLDDRDDLIAALRHEPGLRDVRSPTDVDLILAAFRAWGEAGVARLVGDFALVVWDPTRRRLFAARDALGVRPLVYRREGHRIHFASEVRQVLAAPGVTADVFEPAIAAHLVGRFEDPSWTPYEGVHNLPAGHALTAEAGTERVARFWDVDPGRRLRLRSEEAYVEAFRDVFERAVADRLRSERPVGVLLSGGVDSGSVASMAGHVLRSRGQDTSRVHTYSWAFDRLREADERHVSDLINAHYGFTARPIDGRRPLAARGVPGPRSDAQRAVRGRVPRSARRCAGPCQRGRRGRRAVRQPRGPARGRGRTRRPWAARSRGVGCGAPGRRRARALAATLLRSFVREPGGAAAGGRPARTFRFRALDRQTARLRSPRGSCPSSSSAPAWPDDPPTASNPPTTSMAVPVETGTGSSSRACR